MKSQLNGGISRGTPLEKSGVKIFSGYSGGSKIRGKLTCVRATGGVKAERRARKWSEKSVGIRRNDIKT